MNAAIALHSHPLENIEQFAAEQITQWLALCDGFLDWQRENLLDKEPTPEILKEHRAALKWILRFMRLAICQVSDPDFSDHSLKRELEIRLQQFEDFWSMFHNNSMSAEEADALLAKVFPE